MVGMLQCMNHNGFAGAPGSFLYPCDVSKEGYEILWQKWMSSLVVQDLISCAEMVPEIPEYGILYVISELILTEMARCKPYLRGFYMLPEAHPILMIHTWKIMEHSSSNGCLI